MLSTVSILFSFRALTSCALDQAGIYPLTLTPVRHQLRAAHDTDFPPSGDREHSEGYEFLNLFLFHLGLVIYYFLLQVRNHNFHAHFEFPCDNKEKKMEL